jgi:hypothetical protein
MERETERKRKEGRRGENGGHIFIKIGNHYYAFLSLLEAELPPYVSGSRLGWMLGRFKILEKISRLERNHLISQFRNFRSFGNIRLTYFSSHCHHHGDHHFGFSSRDCCHSLHSRGYCFWNVPRVCLPSRYVRAERSREYDPLWI